MVRLDEFTVVSDVLDVTVTGRHENSGYWPLDRFLQATFPSMSLRDATDPEGHAISSQKHVESSV